MERISRVILLISSLIIFSFSSIIICFPAIAVLRTHHESPGVLRYHAQNSLSDNRGMTWQVILFPEYDSGQVAKYHLRLVGFPGVTQFVHPYPLEIITAQGQVLDAVDMIAIAPPAPNVGEFDLTDILPFLPQKGSAKLSIFLRNAKSI
ncbi:MAG: DUF3122 domain-containing protein [Cyanobacteria bacterium P01_F01_bin.143]